MCDDTSGSTHDYASEFLVYARSCEESKCDRFAPRKLHIDKNQKPQNNDPQELAEPNGVTPQVNINENPHFEDAEPRAGQVPPCVSTFDKRLVKAVPGAVLLACKATRDAQSEAKHIESDWSERL